MTEADFDRDALIQRAAAARQRAYAPYSGYQVGAALLAASGRIYAGCNVENAVYSLTTCAERAAVFRAVCDGERRFRAIAVVTENGGAPCGSCRQVLREFGEETIVLIADTEGRYRETSVAELLPDSFSSVDLD
ncbi:MAG: cytidine deaminase [Chloroflexota bacterium]